MPFQVVVLLAFAGLFPLPAQAQPAGVEQLLGEWTGSYVCGQGETGLTLSFERGSGTSLHGIFAFFPVDGNPSVPIGSFNFKASLGADGRSVSAKAGNWISQPANYVTVDFSGQLSPDGARISGEILDTACSVFEVRRAAKRK